MKEEQWLIIGVARETGEFFSDYSTHRSSAQTATVFFEPNFILDGLRDGVYRLWSQGRWPLQKQNFVKNNKKTKKNQWDKDKDRTERKYGSPSSVLNLHQSAVITRLWLRWRLGNRRAEDNQRSAPRYCQGFTHSRYLGSSGAAANVRPVITEPAWTRSKWTGETRKDEMTALF